MEADVRSLKIEKVEVTSDSAIALVTGVKKQDYEKMNFMDVRSFWYHLVMTFVALRDLNRREGISVVFFSF